MPSAINSVARRRLASPNGQSFSAAIDYSPDPFRALWQNVLGLGVAKTCGAARKKAIVALARQLAVDLWRIATGRVKAEELGLTLRPSV